MTKEIILTNGKTTLVDDEDYPFLNQFGWYESQGYPTKMFKSIEGKRYSKHLHNFVLPKIPGFDTDHINGNRLDNRKENLRYATRNQNNMNRFAKKVTSLSPYKGVIWRPIPKRWKAYIKLNKKQIHLGYFDTAEMAAEAYNNAAIKLFGEFANLNKILITSWAMGAKEPTEIWS